MQNILFNHEQLGGKEKWFVTRGCNYFIIDNEVKLKRLAAILRGSDIIAYDLETTGFNVKDNKIVGASFCVKPGQAFYVPLAHYSKKQNISKEMFVSYLKDILETYKIVGHNLKFDYKFTLYQLGIKLNCAHDTYIIAKLLDEFDTVRLKYLGEVLLGFEVLEMDEVLSQYKVGPSEFDLLRPEECYEYACQDVDLTLRLLNYFISEYNWTSDYIYQVEMELIPTIAAMELRGVQIDLDFLKKLDKEYEEIIKGHTEHICRLLGCNINVDSPKEFGSAFLKKFPEMKRYVSFTEKSGVLKMTEIDVKRYKNNFTKVFGEDYDNIFQVYMERKKAVSLKTKYINSWLDMLGSQNEPIILTSFTSLGAATGRMSSQNPNMQNIAPKIRYAIIPRKGYYLLSMDFDQVEWRIFSAVAGLDHLIEGMNKGEDIHSMAASLLFQLPMEFFKKPLTPEAKEIRSKAKTLNFGVLYGMGIPKLSAALGISEEEAAELKEKYDARFLKNTDWFKRVIKFAKINGHVLTSFGRKRRIDNINVTVDPWAPEDERKEAKRLKGEAIRKAINTPIQGTSADVTKIALNKSAKYIISKNYDIHQLLVIHDDIVFEVNEKYAPEEIIPEMKSCLEMKFKDKVYLTVDNNVSFSSWGALKDG